MVVDKHKNVKWGLLCESESVAKEMGYDYTTGYKFTGLDTYLKEIFKGVHDWEYKKPLYYIELTKEVVKKIFNVNVKKKLFDAMCPSMTAYNENTPYFMCKDGFDEMMSNFETISKDQYEITREHLDWLDFGTGLSGVEKFYEM